MHLMPVLQCPLTDKIPRPFCTAAAAARPLVVSFMKTVFLVASNLNKSENPGTSLFELLFCAIYPRVEARLLFCFNADELEETCSPKAFLLGRSYYIQWGKERLVLPRLPSTPRPGLFSKAAAVDGRKTPPDFLLRASDCKNIFYHIPSSPPIDLTPQQPHRCPGSTLRASASLP